MLISIDPEAEAGIVQDGDSEHTGWYSYQILFLLEAALTIVVALTAFKWLSKGPGSAWWLEDGAEREWAEKRILLDRSGLGEAAGDIETGAGRRKARRGSGGGEEGEELLREDGVEEVGFEDVDVGKGIGGEAGLTKRDVIEAFSDWKVWWILVINICSSVPGMAFSVFLPLVVKVLCPHL